jgi:tRNA dimethylallyltransferase
MRCEFFLVGPTAVGKSVLAVEVAEKLGAEILNADAYQIYRGLDVLTAKPNAAAQARVSHHLLSAVRLSEKMSAAKFRGFALTALSEIHSRGKTAIVVSGSGLYVKGLTRGFDRKAPPNPKLRTELSALSLEELATRLTQLDPELAARMDLRNPRRIIRALEIAQGNVHGRTVVATAIPDDRGAVVPQENLPLLPGTAAAASIQTRAIPSEGEGSRPEGFKVTPRDPSTLLRFARDDREGTHGIFVVRERDDIYARINERVVEMFRAGVEKEVSGLRNVGPTAMQALGLRDIQELLAGKISREQCIASIQRATRRYAKRQLTWFRHQTNFPQLNLTALSHRKAISAITRAIAQA